MLQIPVLFSLTNWGCIIITLFTAFKSSNFHHSNESSTENSLFLFVIFDFPTSLLAGIGLVYVPLTRVSYVGFLEDINVFSCLNG